MAESVLDHAAAFGAEWFFAFLVAIGFGILAKQLLNEYQRKAELGETDYIAAKAIESIIGAKDVISLLSTLKRIGEEYAETLKHREEWRARIKELEGGE